MRCLLYGVAAAALLYQAPAMADCADEIAALEGDLASTQEGRTAEGADANGAAPAVEAEGKSSDGSPEEVVEKMVEEDSVTVEDGKGSTKLSGTGGATPTENWFGKPPMGEEAAAHLVSAKRLLEDEGEDACMAEVEKAREAMTTESPS
jgi:hypothetical protein